MKSGHPQIRSRPPKLPADATKDALERLDKLQEWTEQPSRDVAAAVDAGEGTPLLPVASNAPVEGQGGDAPKKSRGKPAEPEYPWLEFEGLDIPSSVLLRIPKSLHMKAKYLGETTYGDSMAKLMQRGIEHEVAKIMKERGLK